jgi:hypothetical protein
VQAHPGPIFASRCKSATQKYERARCSTAFLPTALLQVLAHISLMRPGVSPSASLEAARAQGASLIHLPGPRPTVSAPIRLVSDSDETTDSVSRGRANLSDDGGGGSAFMRSRQAEEAAARARTLSNDGQLHSQVNLRSSPWQDAGAEFNGNAAMPGARWPSSNVLGDGANSRSSHHVSAPAASDSLAVFEKPLLSALSADEVGGIQAAEVVVPMLHLSCDVRIYELVVQDSSDPYMARASYYERLGRAARKYREGLSKDALDSSQ